MFVDFLTFDDVEPLRVASQHHLLLVSDEAVRIGLVALS